MAIGTDDGILKYGTQDAVHSGTPATIASGSIGKADQGASINWTNDDDAPFGAAVLKCQFDTTMPTEGTLGLIANLLNVQSTNDLNVPDSSFPHIQVGAFPIDFGVANDTDFYTAIPFFRMPMILSAQAIDWYVFNKGTGQTLGVSWELYITPIAIGPHA